MRTIKKKVLAHPEEPCSNQIRVIKEKHKAEQRIAMMDRVERTDKNNRLTDYVERAYTDAFQTIVKANNQLLDCMKCNGNCKDSLKDKGGE